MRSKPATPDVAVAILAAQQHGVVSAQQLLEAGLTRAGISRRLAGGRLHHVHRAVYAVGHARLSSHGRWTAAILASGGTLSHRSAAELWRLLPPKSGPVDVTIFGDAGREKRSGIRVHRSRTLAPTHATVRAGIPVTTPARTIADLRRTATKRGGAASPQELRRAIRQAGVLGLRIDNAEEVDRTRSELEYLFLRLCQRHELPVPEVNVRIDAFLVDFLWRDQRLIVETDGYRFHGDRAAFEEDRERDLKLKSLGYEVIRLSYRQLENQPKRVLGVLRSALLDA